MKVRVLQALQRQTKSRINKMENANAIRFIIETYEIGVITEKEMMAQIEDLCQKYFKNEK